MTFSQKIKKKGTILSIVSTEPLPLTKWNFSKKKCFISNILYWVVTWGHHVWFKEKFDWDTSTTALVQTMCAVTGLLAAHFNSSLPKLAFFLPNPWRLLLSAAKSRFKAISACETSLACGSDLSFVFGGLSQKYVFGSQLGYSVNGTTHFSQLFSPPPSSQWCESYLVQKLHKESVL